MRRSPLIAPRLFVLSCLIFLFAGSAPIGPPEGVPQEGTGEVQSIVNDVEAGITRGATAPFEEHLAGRVYLHLRDSEEGYFSAGQAALVLRHFFSVGKILTFHFSTVQTGTTEATATGGGTLMVQGSPRLLQVYIVLSRSRSLWTITQFNVF